MAAAAWFDDPVDRIMAVMERAFDPAFGEAWSRRQVSDALLLGTCRHALVAPDGQVTDAPRAATAGFALTRAVLDEEELLLIAVDPACRGQGLGTALLERWIEAARARGARRLFLEMRRGNPAAGLYEAHAFRTIGTRPGYYRCGDGTRLDALSFERVLE